MKKIKNEDGASLVEMAFVLPLLILIIFGALEFGLAFKERLTVASAANSAARTGATMGNRLDADIRILEAIEVGLYGQVDPGVIIRVEIFSANQVTGAKTTSLDAYTYDAGDPLCKWNPCPDPDVPGGGPAGSWLPTDRDTTLDPGGGGLDVLGVEITYHHSPITNLMPLLERNFVETALVRLEPDVFGTGS
jgi:hypothetical protein